MWRVVAVSFGVRSRPHGYLSARPAACYVRHHGRSWVPSHRWFSGSESDAQPSVCRAGSPQAGPAGQRRLCLRVHALWVAGCEGAGVGPGVFDCEWLGLRSAHRLLERRQRCLRLEVRLWGGRTRRVRGLSQAGFRGGSVEPGPAQFASRGDRRFLQRQGRRRQTWARAAAPPGQRLSGKALARSCPRSVWRWLLSSSTRSRRSTAGAMLASPRSRTPRSGRHVAMV